MESIFCAPRVLLWSYKISFTSLRMVQFKNSKLEKEQQVMWSGGGLEERAEQQLIAVARFLVVSFLNLFLFSFCVCS